MLPSRGSVILVLILGLLCASADYSPAQVTHSDPPWKWSNERVTQTVNLIRAGRDLTPASWPHGAKVAVLLSFDIDAETLALVYGNRTIGELSQGEYGARVGLQRVISVLDRHEVPASFFIPVVSLQLHPEMLSPILQSGQHEVGVHGWIHERVSALSEPEERALTTQSVEYLTNATGIRPVGYRAPGWEFSPHTIRILQDLGFLYDSSLMADDRPYELLSEGKPTGMIELPVEWILDDYPLLHLSEHRYSSPGEVLQVYLDEFEKAYEEGTMFLLTLHPQVIGHRSRIIVLERLISQMKKKNGVWFATHRAAAEYVRDRSGVGGN